METRTQELHKSLLDKLRKAKGKKLPKSRLILPDRLKKRLQVADAEEAAALEALVGQKAIAFTRSGKGGSYRLLSEGETYLERLAPEPVATNPSLLPYQKAFVLLRFFLAEDKTLTKADLENKASAKDALAYLEFGGAGAGGGNRANSQLIDTILQLLEKQGALSRSVTHGTERFTLTDKGEELLMASDQYPSYKFQLHLTGKMFNQLREAVRRGMGLPVPTGGLQESTRLDEARAVEPPSSQETITPTAILQMIEDLQGEKYQRTGIVPIWELRRLASSRFGPTAARHDAFDPLLKQMRREDQIRLVAIGDKSRATSDQLDDSIPGENETFFHVEVARDESFLR